MMKTIFLLFGLSITTLASAQFAKGAKLLEGGVNFRTDFKIGNDAIDISSGVSPNDIESNSFGLNLSFGAFSSAQNEWGVTAGYSRSGYRSNTFFFDQFGSLILFRSNTIQNNAMIGLYYRRYFPFATRLYGGFTLGMDAGNSWIKTKSGFDLSIDNPFVETSNETILNASVYSNLFLSYLFSQKFGARISTGGIAFQILKSSRTDVTDANFALNLNTTFSPTISFFWIINGKSDDRD
ncbi:MAG: hypothetical protein IPK76_26400 [Lewinellaceae bacterium]|nr:hypothetical protein [Lewinellaceae bacterium]